MFTAIMWMLYVYLWVPLLSLGAWGLGFELAYDVMIRSGGIKSLGPTLLTYLSVLGAIVAMVVLWSLTNRARFRHSPRRKAVRTVSDEEMAGWFGIDREALKQLRASKCARIDFDPEGRPSLRSRPDSAPDATIESVAAGDVD